MKVLITGATGYVGQNLLPELVSANPAIEILTVNKRKEEAVRLFPVRNCRHISIDQLSSISDFNPNLVFHLATLSTSRNDREIVEPLLQANITFGVKLLQELSNCAGLELFVNIGSFAEYRLGPQKFSPAYLYTASKSAFRHFADYYSNLSGFKCTHLVPYTIYGGRDRSKKLIDYIFDSLSASQPIKMTKGEQVLDFIHISDFVAFLIFLSKNMSLFKSVPNGEEYHIGTGVGTKVRDLAKLIEKITGQKCNIDWGGISYRPMDTMYSVAPIAKNIEQLNWRASITIENGLRDQLKIYKMQSDK